MITDIDQFGIKSVRSAYLGAFGMLATSCSLAATGTVSPWVVAVGLYCT